MGRSLILAVLVLFWPSAVAAGELRWWLDPVVQRELALSPRQVSTIDALYRRTLPTRRALRDRLNREERALKNALADGPLDDATAALLIDRVESARSHHNIARVSMLVRIYFTLSTQQRERLAALPVAKIRTGP